MGKWFAILWRRSHTTNSIFRWPEGQLPRRHSFTPTRNFCYSSDVTEQANVSLKPTEQHLRCQLHKFCLFNSGLHRYIYYRTEDKSLSCRVLFCTRCWMFFYHDGNAESLGFLRLTTAWKTVSFGGILFSFFYVASGAPCHASGAPSVHFVHPRVCLS